MRFVAHDAAAARAFDRLAAEALEGIRAKEPSPLVSANHAVPNELNVDLL
ncbi:hypothetical protein [Kitasatospora sp. NPDC015120]